MFGALGQFQIPQDLEPLAWFADSGALHHITFTASDLQIKFSCTVPKHVVVGNGYSM